MYEDIKQNVTRIVIATIILLSVMCTIAFLKNIYDNFVTPKYTKAICQVNGESLEIKIDEIKKIEDAEYLITDDKGAKWQLSSRMCTFVE